MWFEDPFKAMPAAQPIIESALGMKADVLAVACPYCLINIEDVVKLMGVEEKLAVKEISELICSSLD
jgi:Fe-S oxidoreductase